MKSGKKISDYSQDFMAATTAWVVRPWQDRVALSDHGIDALDFREFCEGEAPFFSKSARMSPPVDVLPQKNSRSRAATKQAPSATRFRSFC